MTINIQNIFINADTSEENEVQLYATLAHEISHHYLFSKNIYLQNSDKNEFLTELCAIYLGFGYLLLEGYRYKREKNNRIKKVGYISSKIVFDAIIQTAYIRKQNPQNICKNLNFPEDLIAWVKLYKLRKAYENHKMKNMA